MSYTLKRFEAETNTESYIREYVNVDEFLACCRVCPNYGKVWSCPPYDFDPAAYWNAFDKILVAGYQLTFDDDRTEEGMREALWDVKKQLAEEMRALEDQFPGSQSLSAATCQICREYSRADGHPCRFPDRMRYSIESIGGNVGKTISDFCGIEIEWGKGGELPEHPVLVGGLLKKNPD